MIITIKDKLKNDTDTIIDILNDINCHNINVQKNKIRFGTDSLGSGTGNIVEIDTLKYYSFSQDKTRTGDIFVLIENQLGLTFKQALHWLAKRLNITITGYVKKKPKRLPFGGFYREYIEDKYELQSTEPPITYEESVLNDYILMNSRLWFEDGILYSVQERFGVGYDVISKRITLPIRDEMGNLCGVLGRVNEEEIPLYKAKYLSLLKCDRSKILFGLYENYTNILTKNRIYVAEAEKSVLQALSKEIDNVVAIGKHEVSFRQAMLLKTLAVNEIIIAFDEGVPFEDCCKQIERIKSKGHFFQNKVGILYDFDNKYLPKGSKMSPYDLDKDTLEEFQENCIVWENEVDKYKTVSIEELFGNL